MLQLLIEKLDEVDEVSRITTNLDMESEEE